MQLNITLFIQIVHFLIAYLLLRYFFLKPAIVALEKRNAHEQELQLLLRIEEEKVEAQQKKQNLLWKDAKRRFTEYIQVCDQKIIKPVLVVPIEYSHELPNAKEPFVQEIAREIEKRVEHVG